MTSKILGRTTMQDWFIIEPSLSRARYSRAQYKPPDGPVKKERIVYYFKQPELEVASQCSTFKVWVHTG